MFLKIVIPLIGILFIGCGGSSGSSTSPEPRANIDANSFEELELYGFRPNFVDRQLRYDMDKIDPIEYSLTPYYFDFDTADFEMDTKDKQIFVNGKRATLADTTYTLDNSGGIVASIDSQDIFTLSIVEERSIKTEKLEEYHSDIAIEGQQYTVATNYVANFHTIKDLASDDTFDTLSTFITKYSSISFSTGLLFSSNNKIKERQDDKYIEIGTYELKKIDKQEIIFVYPDDTNRYGTNLCYILDFSRVWESECHLKKSSTEMNFYDKAVYDDVVKYMQSNFVNVDISI